MFGGGPAPIEEGREAENKEEVTKALLREADTAILTARTILSEAKGEKERLLEEHAELMMTQRKVVVSVLAFAWICFMDAQAMMHAYGGVSI
eukprot:scaffold97280_cov40-Tisochrysis_lutea.AAC.1